MTGQLPLDATGEATSLVQWRIVLNTGRLGDWVIVDAESEQDAIRQLTRTQRKRVSHVRRCVRTRDHLAQKGTP